MMGVKKEWGIDKLDQMLNHLILIPFVGIQVQEIMDDFGFTKGSSNLTALVTTKMDDLKENL